MTRATKVLLNALFLDPNVSGGPETYLRGLVPALQATRSDASLTVATTRRGARSLAQAGWPQQGITVRALPCDEGERLRRQVAEQLLLPRLARRLDAQVLHSLSSVAPIRVRGLAHAVTLHDVNFIHHSTFNPVTTWGLRQVIPRAARRADALIADTRTARDDICATLGLAPDRFTVIYLGGAERVPPGGGGGGRIVPPRRLGLGSEQVLLCVGAKRPHKNQALLVRAMEHLPLDIRLVLAGHPEPYEQVLRTLARELGVERRVVFADRVSQDELEGLWSVAAVAAFPTLAEGFGLPLVEAMARGVPVAASDLPVLREVADSWPEFFDPHDPGDAARAIRKVLKDPPDPERGRQLASRFTWTAAAEATWEVYDRALAGFERGRGPRSSRQQAG